MQYNRFFVNLVFFNLQLLFSCLGLCDGRKVMFDVFVNLTIFSVPIFLIHLFDLRRSQVDYDSFCQFGYTLWTFVFFSLFWLATVARRFPYFFVNLDIFNLLIFFYLFKLRRSQVDLRFFCQSGFLFTIIVFLVFRLAVVARRIPFLFVKLICFQVLLSYFLSPPNFQLAAVANLPKSAPGGARQLRAKRSVTAHPPARGVWAILLGPGFVFGLRTKKYFILFLFCSASIPSPAPNLGRFWIIFEGWSQICPSTKLFRMDLNKSVPPWRWKCWRKRYSHTMRMKNQAKLAEGAHRGHIIWASTCTDLRQQLSATPTAALRAAAIWGGGLLRMSRIPPPNMWRRNLNLLTEI